MSMQNAPTSGKRRRSAEVETKDDGLEVEEQSAVEVEEAILVENIL